jgi:hypothetical protein
MPGLTNADLVRKAAGPVGTGDFIAASGLLASEQANAFLDQVYLATPFSALQRNERRRAKTGSIAKIGIGGRLLRLKTAGVDDATLVKPLFGDVSYTCVRSRLDWEVEEEVFEENIEQGGLEDHLMRLMTGQLGRDLEDLHFNGATADTSADAAFLTQNQGWLAQLAASGTTHRVNGGAVSAGAIEKSHFFDAFQALPDKYKAQADLMRWFMSPTNESRWLEYLTSRATPAGDAALLGQGGRSPHGIAIQTIPSMPNTRILLANAKQFLVVNTRDIRIRRTTEGREAIRQDKRFYAIFIDDDPIIEEDDGVVDVYGMAA